MHGKLTEIIDTLEAAQSDARKFDIGIDAPGVRVREALSQAAAQCKALRAEVRAMRDERA